MSKYINYSQKELEHEYNATRCKLRMTELEHEGVWKEMYAICSNGTGHGSSQVTVLADDIQRHASAIKRLTAKKKFLMLLLMKKSIMSAKSIDEVFNNRTIAQVCMEQLENKKNAQPYNIKDNRQGI